MWDDVCSFYAYTVPYYTWEFNSCEFGYEGVLKPIPMDTKRWLYMTIQKSLLGKVRYANKNKKKYTELIQKAVGRIDIGISGRIVQTKNLRVIGQ